MEALQKRLRELEKKIAETKKRLPAQYAILFKQSAEAYLDMESPAIGGTFLSGILIEKR